MVKRFVIGSLLIFAGAGYAQTHSNFARWAEGRIETNDGATTEFYNRAGLLRWQNAAGDWRDANALPNGSLAFAQRRVCNAEENSAIEIGAEALVQGWINGEFPNDGFLLRLAEGNGSVVFASRDHQNPALHPVLHVLTSEGPHALPATADTYLNAAEETSPGDQPQLILSPEANLLIRFDLSHFSPGEKVLAASLHLFVLEARFTEEQLIDVFRCEVPQPDGPGAPQTGLAGKAQADNGLRNDPAVLLFADFEDADWQSSWSYGMNAGTLKIVSSDDRRDFQPLQGRALRVKIPRGKRTGMNAGFNFAEEIGEEPEEIYFRYYLRISSAWQTTHNGKLPGISGTYSRAGWGGRPANGENGWSARGQFRMMPPEGNPLQGRIPVGNYVYHADMQGQYGDSRVWQQGWLGFLEKNRWYCIEQYLRLNTPGKNDGILRGWIDGRLAYEETDWRWRDTDALKIEKIWMNVYHGGSARAPQDIYLYIDNVVIAREYIGPMTGTTVSVRRQVAPGDGDGWRLRSTPNPFRDETLIHFTLQQPQRIRLTVYDLLGRRIRELSRESLPAGSHRLRWDGRDDSGVRVPPGAYFYVLHLPAGQSVMTGRVVLLP